jgi:hypothetical protein
MGSKHRRKQGNPGLEVGLVSTLAGTAPAVSRSGNLLSRFGAKGETSPGRGRPKNREMKECPTMLLITKALFSEPTMLMKTNEIPLVTHDVNDNKRV